MGPVIKKFAFQMVVIVTEPVKWKNFSNMR